MKNKLSTFWTTFQRSLLDFGYYKDVAKASFWFSYKYILLLLICLSVIRSAQLGFLYTTARNKIPSYIATGKRELINVYPKELELRISNGRLYTNVSEPYIIEIPKVFGEVQDRHLIVIDTSASPTAYKSYNTYVLATRDVVVYPNRQRNGGAETTQMYFFSDLKRSMYMDYSGYVKIINQLNPIIAKLPKLIDIVVTVCIFLLPFLGGLLWTSSVLFGLLFLTIFTWIIGKIVGSQYGYKALFRLGIHASTWPILFSFLLDITNQKVDYLYNIIFIGWMTFIIVKNKVKKVSG